MNSIQTPLTTLLGIKTPIIAAAMAGASGGALVAQAALAGGFGFLGCDTPDTFQSELDIARIMLQTADHDTLRIGVSFLVWQLDEDPNMAKNLLFMVIRNHVQAIWLSFGNDIGQWIKFIRSHDPDTGSDRAIKIFVQISSVEQALQAVNEWKVDVVVVQGNEAGGHGLSNGLPLLTLFPLVSGAISNALGVKPSPPLVAAGGLATGAQVAALLTLGASGVALGTRFLLSPESFYTEDQRQALIAADSSDSVRSLAFDYARNSLAWPKGVDGRGLRNDIVTDFEKGVDLETIQAKFTEGVHARDKSRMLVWAGSAVGIMKTIKPAGEIIKELHEECLRSLQSAQLLQPRLTLARL